MNWAISILMSFILFGCTPKFPVTIPSPVPSTAPTPSPYSVSNPKPVMSVMQSMQQELATKYHKQVTEVLITVSRETEHHAKGMVSFQGETSGGQWFSVLEKGGWILVYDGQSTMPCQIADTNEFPQELVPECLTPAGKVQFRSH